MKTAIVHDWIVTRAGAENCLEAIYGLFPSPIHTLVYDPGSVRDSAVLRGAEMHASFLQSIPGAARLYRNFLPLFPRAVESLDVSAADLILSSSHAVAKGVRKRPDQLHICYCYTPMRYAWDLYEQYMSGLDPIRRAAAKVALARLRVWDKATAPRVDHFIAISEHVAERVRRLYGREAAVIYPPVDTEAFSLETKKDPYFITVSRMVPYKRMELIAEAFTALGLPLLIVGDGPERKRVAAKAGPTVKLLGALPGREMRWLVAKARGFIFAAEEDFGIAPVEAMACGTPVIGYGKGALLETVADQEHGVLFREQTAGSLADAVARFERIEKTLDLRAIRRNAERFSRARFDREYKTFVDTKWKEFKGRASSPSPTTRGPQPADAGADEHGVHWTPSAPTGEEVAL